MSAPKESMSRAARVADTLNHLLNCPPKVRPPSWGEVCTPNPPVRSACSSPLCSRWPVGQGQGDRGAGGMEVVYICANSGNYVRSVMQ